MCHNAYVETGPKLPLLALIFPTNLVFQLGGSIAILCDPITGANRLIQNFWTGLGLDMF